MQVAPAKKHPGEVLEIESEEELDKILQEDKDSLTILLGSLTWCRPCKTLVKPLQVTTVLWSLRHGQPSASASSEALRPPDRQTLMLCPCQMLMHVPATEAGLCAAWVARVAFVWN